jgi:WD40 repeat protein
MARLQSLVGWMVWSTALAWATAGASKAFAQAKPVLGDDPVGPLISLTGHKGTGYFITFSANGLFAVSLGGGDYHVWDLSKRRSLNHWGATTTIWRPARPVFATDRNFVLGGSAEEVQLTNPLNGRKIGGPLKMTDDVIRWTDISADNTLVATGSRKGLVYIWSIKDGKKLNEFNHGSEIVHTAFSPDGKWLLTACGEKTMRLWNLEKDRQERVFEGHTDALLAVGFSSDGRKAFSASGDNTVRVWEVETGKEIAKIEAGGKENRLTCTAFSPKLGRALTGHSDGTVAAWDLDSRERLALFDKHKRQVTSVAVSPDGQHALSGDDTNAESPVWLYRLPPKK